MSDRTWNETFAVLQALLHARNDSAAPHSCRTDDDQLNRWIARQRAQHRAGMLSDDRQRHLANLPGWSWETVESQWEFGFRRLVDYIDRFGDARVPHTFIVDGLKLGQWVSTQRKNFRTGRLASERRLLLEGVPGWTWDARNDRWDGAFRRLNEFVARNGHARVPLTFVDGDFRLGEWVHNQRCAFARGDLSAARADHLEQVAGWSWTPFEDRWDLAYQSLQAFVAEHGHSRVPWSYRRDGFALGAWVSQQFRQHTAGTLSDDRRSRLEASLGWEWPEPPASPT